ncbi:MAG: sensor histidine kinase [Dorea formicigenerans]|nr:sensor histidine kinase [Dorea formicigenerans]
MSNYNHTYNKIVQNLTIANNYNLDFKDEMDESLYKMVVGYVTVDGFDDAEELKSPYVLIKDLRKEFRNLKKITTDTESKLWLDSLLRNIDTLEDRVDDLVENIHVGGTYDSNIKELDDNIYILTELIQDDIQYYIYYQTESMEKVTDTLNTQIRTFIIICACLIAVLTIGLAMAVMQITTGMLRPIQVLAQAAGRISEGDLDARADVDSRDEIAVLADRFNDMAGNIQTLVVKVREDEQKMRKADLRLLQEQINPHFLYNTLDNIVWLIEGNEPDEAVEMVVTLSEFFRLVLSKGKEFITIRQEEQHISSYLQIQGKRYHDILDYHIYIDPEIYEYQIPKLTLQPLVENALYHGIKYKRSRGMIEITGTKEGENLYLTVADDGVGMDEDELKKLEKEISRPCKETESGFGLANVNERIRMYFGSEYGMKIWSEKGSGTRITIEIPAITDNPEKPEAVKQSIRSEEAENEAKK